MPEGPSVKMIMSDNVCCCIPICVHIQLSFEIPDISLRFMGTHLKGASRFRSHAALFKEYNLAFKSIPQGFVRRESNRKSENLSFCKMKIKKELYPSLFVALKN